MDQQQQTREHSQSVTIDASPDQVFAFVSEIGNLPKYLPPITSAEPIPPDKIRLQGEVPNHGKIDGEGYYHVHQDERRMKWGSNVGRDYSGQLTVAGHGEGQSELTVELSFGPRSVEPQIEQESGPERDPLQEAVGATLESIRREIEGEGGKVQPPPPPAH